jgi:hypothetical protein
MRVRTSIMMTEVPLESEAHSENNESRNRNEESVMWSKDDKMMH